MRAPRSCAIPIRHEQDLCRRLGVGQRAVAGARVGREAVRQRSEVRRLASEQPPREPDRVDHRGCDALPCQPHRLVVEKRHVEACVVRDEHGVSCEARKCRTAAATGGARRSCSSRRPVNAEIAGCSRTPGLASVSKRSVSSRRSTPDGPELARTGRRRAGARSSRGRRRRTWRPRGGAPPPAHRPGRPDRPTSGAARRPAPPRRAASARARRALRSRASARPGRPHRPRTGPRCSSTSSTSRSAASRRSCTPRC